MPDERYTERQEVIFWLVLAATAAILVSIAAWQILLGVALGWILWTTRRLEFPRSMLAAAAFLGWTLISAFTSAGPMTALPQIRKFYVWFTLPVVYTAIRGTTEARRVLTVLVAVCAASGLWSFVQLGMKWQEARSLGQPFYQYYVGARTVGFMSHWETFGGQLMMIACAALACAMFATGHRMRMWMAGAFVLVGVALAASFTRSAWLGAAIGCLVLVFLWKRWLILLTPVAVAAMWFFAPGPLQERIQSAWQPRTSDSNSHREALRATGWAMAREHPFVGFGPEQIQRNVPTYMPQRYQPIPKEWWYGHLHNIYLQYAAERGWPAVVALMGFAIWTLLDFARPWRGAAPETRVMLGAAIAGTVAVFTAGFFEHNLGDSEVLGLWLALLALGYSSLRTAPAGTRDTS